MSGWISVDRAITKHWIWQGEKFTKGKSWIDLLLFAAHTDNKVLIKGTLIPVSRGEQIRSQVTLAKAWNWDRKTVSRFLKLLEKDGMIVSRVDHLTSYVSICNYDSFQDNSNTNPQHKGQVKGQQSPSREDTINKGNKDNKDNKDISRINYTEIMEYYNERMPHKKIKKMTDARKTLVKKLFDKTKIDMETFKAFIDHVSQSPEWNWTRIDNVGTNGVKYGARPFDYYMTESNLIKAMED